MDKLKIRQEIATYKPDGIQTPASLINWLHGIAQDVNIIAIIHRSTKNPHQYPLFPLTHYFKLSGRNAIIIFWRNQANKINRDEQLGFWEDRYELLQDTVDEEVNRIKTN